MNTNDAVAKRILQLLRERKMSQYRLEKESGISHGGMDAILMGKNKTVTLEIVYRLARGFNMSIYEFLDADAFRSEYLEIE